MVAPIWYLKISYQNNLMEKEWLPLPQPSELKKLAR